MPALTVCNFVTVDGRYEDDDHDIASFFEYQHPDYHGADTFDHYTTSLLAEADTLVPNRCGNSRNTADSRSLTRTLRQGSYGDRRLARSGCSEE